MNSLESDLSHQVNKEKQSQREKVTRLRLKIKDLYEGTEERLPFHGWPHVDFVARKGLEFATIEQQRLFEKKEIEKIDPEAPYFVEAICLVHELNNFVETVSHESVGEKLRRQILQEVGYADDQIQHIEDIVQYKENKSFLAHCYLDADDAAKFDPEFRKVANSNTFTKEQNISEEQLAENIMRVQLQPVLEGKRPIFYTALHSNNIEISSGRICVNGNKNIKNFKNKK